MSLRDDFFAFNDFDIKPVKIKGFAGLFVRTPSVADLAVIMDVNSKDPVKGQAHVVALCACDKDGERVFTLDDVDSIMKKSPSTVDKIHQEAAKLINAEYSVDDAEKN